MVEVAAEKNSTLVLPFPVELLRFVENAHANLLGNGESNAGGNNTENKSGGNGVAPKPAVPEQAAPEPISTDRINRDELTAAEPGQLTAGQAADE